MCYFIAVIPPDGGELQKASGRRVFCNSFGVWYNLNMNWGDRPLSRIEFYYLKKNNKGDSIMMKAFKMLYKVGVVTAGVTAMFNPVGAAVTGGVAIASAVASAVKDKNFKPAMRVINVIACNMDYSTNDKRLNS